MAEAGISGEDYGFADVLFDGGSGAIVAELGTPRGRHAAPTFTEIHADTIVESGGSIIEGNFQSDD